MRSDPPLLDRQVKGTTFVVNWKPRHLLRGKWLLRIPFGSKWVHRRSNSLYIWCNMDIKQRDKSANVQTNNFTKESDAPGFEHVGGLPTLPVQHIRRPRSHYPHHKGELQCVLSRTNCRPYLDPNCFAPALFIATTMPTTTAQCPKPCPRKLDSLTV